jgi:sugar phosphate isomerase/epimerase
MTRRSFVAALAAALPTLAQTQKTKKPTFGLQTYSLRYDLQKDFPGTLAFIRKLGFKELEVSNWPGHSAAEYRRLLDDHGLQAVSMMAAYQQLDTAVETVAADAHALGAPYVVCSTLPQKNYMTAEECRHGADFLNRRGETLAAANLRLCYHTHGTEFHPAPGAPSPAGRPGSPENQTPASNLFPTARLFPGATIFDLLAQSTDPRHANFEMDIYWIVYAGQDPVELLQRHPNRFPLTHIKDIRPGLQLGGLPRDVREEDSVQLGTGLVDIPAALHAAQETGVKHYFIEDEAVEAAEQIPKSLKFLEEIEW